MVTVARAVRKVSESLESELSGLKAIADQAEFIEMAVNSVTDNLLMRRPLPSWC